jgi:hypothetical protein
MAAEPDSSYVELLTPYNTWIHVADIDALFKARESRKERRPRQRKTEGHETSRFIRMRTPRLQSVRGRDDRDAREAQGSRQVRLHRYVGVFGRDIAPGAQGLYAIVGRTCVDLCALDCRSIRSALWRSKSAPFRMSSTRETVRGAFFSLLTRDK